MLRGIDGAIDVFITGYETPPQFNYSLRCTLPAATGTSASNRSEIVDYRLSIF
jgi:hypothetical protein